jgi:hypothetical protein
MTNSYLGPTCWRDRRRFTPRLVPKGSHLADGLDETISQRSAARRAVQRLDLALARHKVLYYRMGVRELVGPWLVWTPRP